MNLTDIALHRLNSQKISNTTFIHPEETIAWMGAIQGQDYPGAKWSIALRTLHTTEKDIEKAFANKQIVRSWLMRGTLHLVASADIRWILSLVSDRIISSCARRYRELELDAKTLSRSNDILVKVLGENDSLNRKQLLEFLQNHGISTDGQRAAYLLQRACLDGLIVQGNTIKNCPVYYALSHIKTKPTPSREECLRELAMRYFVSRGPASLADFGWWSGFPLKETRIGLEACKQNLMQTKFNGTDFFYAPTTFTPQKAGIHLLPGFDEFLLAYKDRTASLHPTHSGYWCPGNNGMFLPFILIDGFTHGIWKKSIKNKSLMLETNFFAPPDSSVEPILSEVFEKYVKYYGQP